ncbi:MAG: Rne/Rng family ribonuclease [Acidimicrobiia bacterium]|nr:Rne/Rng family ribonuclease [Acidimicrobiia bacterium]
MPAPSAGDATDGPADEAGAGSDSGTGTAKRRRRRGSRSKTRTRSDAPSGQPVEHVIDDEPVELDEETLQSRRGKERKGRPVGRYLMAVHVSAKATHIAVLEGRNLVEHYVSRPSDDATQIHGNIYLGRVQNVLPGMEAAFVDIGTPKNAVLYRGDVQYDKDDIEGQKGQPRIEQVLRARQTILSQVTKNPIAHKGARLTQEVSLPGRFVVLIPNSPTTGISKRLPDAERRRLRSILDSVRPENHGLIVRTAAENVTEEELVRDVARLSQQWTAIEQLAKRSKAPALLYREPDLAVRIIREEFNADYRSVVIDDPRLYEEIRDYVRSISPELAERVELFDPTKESLPLFERYHVHEQLLRATEKKVWLPSGGSLIIEHTEALTVIDVNTGKNVGKRSLEETVFHNNLEAAEEIARQLRLRDIGGIIVIDFVDMEVRPNREEVVRVFRNALARDKTRTQAFDITDLGLVEMTRKRIGEGLLESVTTTCDCCSGRGVQLDPDLVGENML